MQRIDKFSECPKCGGKNASVKYDYTKTWKHATPEARTTITTEEWLLLTCGVCGWICKFACLDSQEEETENLEPMGLEN
jgi:formate hydrogenlyase subunit 6/NADH:ubiquinone oxidoreductase subunit I